MDVGCIVAGACLIASGIALSRLRPPDWRNDGEMEEEHRLALARWSGLQRGVRILNNSLLVLIGGAIIASVFVPRGQAWIILWCVILLMLLVCILLAMIDAVGSLAGYGRALPEAARRATDAKHGLH